MSDLLWYQERCDDLEREIDTAHLKGDAQEARIVSLTAQRDHARAWCGYWQLLACRMRTDHLRGTLVGVASDGWDGYLASMRVEPDGS
jgi:hypothetical protein